jgi:BirA family biotin operon repressor/biotin-[acetyl-CoA-carboxylase] ligase
VNQTPEDFSEDVREMATSLSQVLGRTVRRTELAAQVLLALDRMYSGYPAKKEEYLARYRAGCITLGRQVQLITPTSRRDAFALEIDDSFDLVVELPDGSRETVTAGEVSVRGMFGYV